MRTLYEWVLSLAERPRAIWALAAVSFAESSFFPIPPDVMLLPMCIARQAKSYVYAAWCSVASIFGGMAGYAIGMFLWASVGEFFFNNVPGVNEKSFGKIQLLYEEYNFWIVFAAGFSPLPYKLFTIAAGVFGISFPIFVLASAVSRSARFFLEAFLIKRWGEPAQRLIDKHFNLVALAFVVLLVGGFWLAGRL